MICIDIGWLLIGFAGFLVSAAYYLAIIGE